MARIPSRIFADRYFREARRIEALHASQISPGTSTWREALQNLFKRMGEAGSPIKQAAMLKAAITYMESVRLADAMHIGFVRGTCPLKILERLSAETAQLVELHWPAIEKVAHALMLRSELSEADVDQLRRTASRFRCVDCGCDTCPRGQLHEYYVVHDTIWAAAGMTPDGGSLCVECLERRLGRQLNRTDFTNAPVNDPTRPHSARLRDRLQRPTEETPAA